MASLLTASLLPRPGKSERKQVLTILLAQAFQSDNVSESMKTKINTTIEQELSNIEPCIVTITHVERGEYNVDGTLTDIYTVAREAQKLGWLSMIIMDVLSTRQLLGTTRWGEQRTLMAIAVYLDFQKDDWRPNDSAVFIRRLPLVKAYHAAISPTEKKWSDMVYCPDDVSRPSLTERLDRGMYLSDPYKSSFVDDRIHDQVQHAIAKALDDSEPALPYEIKLSIQSDIREEPSIPDLTDAPAESSLDEGCLRIQSFIHLSSSQLRLATKLVKEAAKNADWTGDVELHQWKQHVPCSRRNFIKLYKRHLQANHEREPYSFLVDYSRTSSQTSVKFGWAVEDQYQQILLVTGSAHDLTRRWVSGTRQSMYQGNELYKQDDLSPESASVERMYDPTNAFPPDTPAWQMPNHGDNPTGVSAPPVYYLTKNLSEEERQAILRALQRLYDHDEDYHVVDGEKKYSFVEWTREEDGTVEDMFRLFWYMRHHRGGRDTSHECIFVDKQTAQDNTVILADARYVGDKKYSGMEYGRIDAAIATTAWVNLDIANMDIFDFVNGESGAWNELLFYKDPDYDGPLTYEEWEGLQ